MSLYVYRAYSTIYSQVIGVIMSIIKCMSALTGQWQCLFVKVYSNQHTNFNKKRLQIISDVTTSCERALPFQSWLRISDTQYNATMTLHSFLSFYPFIVMFCHYVKLIGLGFPCSLPPANDFWKKTRKKTSDSLKRSQFCIVYMWKRKWLLLKQSFCYWLSAHTEYPVNTQNYFRFIFSFLPVISGCLTRHLNLHLDFCTADLWQWRSWCSCLRLQVSCNNYNDMLKCIPAGNGFHCIMADREIRQKKDTK